MSSPLQYRPEIDGLRAVAVLPVILFHAGFAPFSGGYVGVDVFFVISGYLITSIILGELATDTFSIARFYERRARRILPALFLVTIACIPFALVLLAPTLLRDFGQSLVAVATFSSNILFWIESGYFDTTTDLKPLLHTWSLAVEEQYYVIVPLLMLGLWKIGQRSLIAVLAILFVASFALSQVWWKSAPNAAFYLLPARGWEILLGAFAAFPSVRARAARVPAPLAGALGLAGIVMILAAVFLFDQATAFPNPLNLVPTLGALFIILWAGSGSLAARLLSVRGLVGVGLISYSAYLWHQPIFAFARNMGSSDLSFSIMLGGSALSILLAIASWRFVEVPFRRKTVSLKRLAATLVPGFGAIVAAALVILFVPQVGLYGTGDRNQLSAGMIEDQRKLRFKARADICAMKGWQTCDTLDPSKTNVLIVGDSHAADNLNTLVAIDPTLNFTMSSLGGCPPHPRIEDLASPRYAEMQACKALNVLRFDPAYLAQFDVVVVGVLIHWYTEEHLVAYLDALAAAGVEKVIVFGSTLIFERDLPDLVLQHGLAPIEDFITVDPRPSEPTLAAAVEDRGYLFIRKMDTFCPKGACRFINDNGILMSYDKHHLSVGFANAIAERYGEVIRRYIDAPE